MGATTTLGSSAYGEFEEATPDHPGAARLVFDPPARLTGIVRTSDGAPVSLRLGLEVSFDSAPLPLVSSNPDGRFEFECIGPGTQRLYSLDEDWIIDDRYEEFEVVSGRTIEVVVIVHPHSAGRSAVR